MQCRGNQLKEVDDETSNLDFNSSAAASECPSYHRSNNMLLRRRSISLTCPSSLKTGDGETMTKVTAASMSEATDSKLTALLINSGNLGCIADQ